MNLQDIQQIRGIVQSEIEKYMTSKQFNVSKIPNHLHNGKDSVKINEGDLIQSPTYSTKLIENVSETFYFTNLPPHLTQLTFNGIAYDSSVSPTVKKAFVSGNANFQNNFTFIGSGNSISIGNISVQSIVQQSSAIYIDTSNLANTRVSNILNIYPLGYFVYVLDSASPANVVASLQIVSFNQGSLQILSHVALNWIIEGAITLT